MRYGVLLLILLAASSFGEGERAGATFKEGVGIHLGPATRVAIGLELAEVEERSTPVEMPLTAQVYREAHEASQNQGEPAGFAYASAWVDPSDAKRLTPGLPLRIPGATGTVLRVDRTMAASGGRVEALLKVQNGERVWKIGDFVPAIPVLSEETSVAVIPREALLETAYGPFVYVVNGEAFLRTAVTTGARRGAFTEITDGLYSGDQVVVRPVETLYLIELRATKGGGHSH
jgi:multidrug efflux pump subunit AcrA (membrane-fusion protein)